MFAKSSYEVQCVNGTLKFLHSPRTSSKAEGNFEPEGGGGDDDIEDCDKREIFQISWSMSREFVQRHIDELRTKLHNPDEQALPDPIH